MPRFNTRDDASISAAIACDQEFQTHGALSGKPHSSGFLGLGRLPEEYHESAMHASYTIYSYATPIAWRDCRTGEWIHPQVKYSRTTTQHQHTARMATR